MLVNACIDAKQPMLLIGMNFMTCLSAMQFRGKHVRQEIVRMMPDTHRFGFRLPQVG